MEKEEQQQLINAICPIQIKPVGIVINQSQEACWGECYRTFTWQEKADRMKAQIQSVSELVIDPALEDMLDGIDEYSHLTVIYWSHLVPEENRRVMKVYPLGSRDFPLVGTFATHSPSRPNNILITNVRILERNDNVIRVTGLDALNGSPILDIKPYQNDHFEPEEIRIPDWLKKMCRGFGEEIQQN